MSRITKSFLIALPWLLAACASPEPVSRDRYEKVDALFDMVRGNVVADDELHEVVEIDHSRLAARGGEVMPPARVLIFSNPVMESRLLDHDPLIGIDLPLRVLAYEDPRSKQPALVYNRFAYIASRYRLDEALGAGYEESMRAALGGVRPERIEHFANDVMPEDGILTYDSSYGFDETLERVRSAIESQDGTTTFGLVDFSERAHAAGLLLRPMTLVLFGAPVPGAKAMSAAPTLGLDAFCQKLLVWEDADGKVRVSFNDLLSLAERQGVGPSVPLRVINRRLNAVFRDAVRGTD